MGLFDKLREPVVLKEDSSAKNGAFLLLFIEHINHIILI